MNGFALLVATAVMGVDYGWQPDADDQLEYIIQIEPMTLIALREGHDIVSQIDPYVRNVRRFRIRVGTDPVPRRGFPPREPSQAAPSPAPPGVEYGWQAVEKDQIEFVVQISPDRLEKLHGREEISGQMPSNLGEIVRLRIQAKPAASQGKELPAGTEGGSVGDTEAPAPVVSAPWVAEESHEWTQLWAVAPHDANSVSSAGTEARQDPAAFPERTTMPGESNAASRYGQFDSRYRSLTDTLAGDSVPQKTPRNEIPLSSLPMPEIGGGQAGEAFQPRTVNPERSVYDQPTYDRGFPNTGSNARADVPRRIDAGQPTAPPATFLPSPRTEYPPNASYPATSSTSPWSGESDPASTAKSFADHSQTYMSDSVAVEDDRQYFGVPDSLASALGYEPWPNRVVSYDVEVTPSPAPDDFWTSLSETANDRSLDYLREGEGEKPWWPLTLAVLGLFASLGGNLYMGWIVAGTYRRYLDLADDFDESDHRDPAARDREEDEWSPRRSRRERRTVDV